MNIQEVELRRRVIGLVAVLLTWLMSAPTSVLAAEDFDLQKFRGKVVVVDFWASWCEPCRRSFPWLNAMQAKYADRGLVVIGVNVDRVRADAEHFLRETPARFEIRYDPTGALAARYEVPGMPTSYVFGPTGELIGRHVGFRDTTREERETELQKALTDAAIDRSTRPPQRSENSP